MGKYLFKMVPGTRCKAVLPYPAGRARKKNSSPWHIKRNGCPVNFGEIEKYGNTVNGQPETLRNFFQFCSPFVFRSVSIVETQRRTVPAGAVPESQQNPVNREEYSNGVE